ncbi:MAG: hypothetical protein A2860_02095 [Candidatus Levybacteria bacterium RIFCSPHIGHO2_01_FULL_37_33]|nr:MAG: hypothetical protein A2860_02095 [Candidatus Levybacteria bacterium RIFCSPHIGHO2_01_FULL_37_33]OGH29958.1 MAG: hypothetical protein A3F30_01490 [Candidatus Levybacteria bacterium RIFCSPHIGHO2_12_FULL_37_12]OGH32657.1 MAG: hypothetical protein A2953_01355 [Candidatus Levybacteria bacterium RIFCSPLOWO2_01_FULL_36_54]
MSYIVRAIRRTETQELKKVFTKTLIEFPEYSKKTRSFFASDPYRKRMISLNNRFGAFVGGKLVAYLLAAEFEGGVSWIYWFAVLKNYQAHGIGTTLLNFFEKLCIKQGVHSIIFYSDKRNVGFYLKRGCRVIGFDEKSYFGPDAYIMKKLIQKPNEKKFLKEWDK